MKIVTRIISSFLKKESGKRFVHTCIKINRLINHNAILHALFLIVAPIVILAGVIMLVVPGPGLLFILIGLLLLAIVSKKVAKSLDQLEIKLMQAKDKLKSNGSK